MPRSLHHKMEVLRSTLGAVTGKQRKAGDWSRATQQVENKAGVRIRRSPHFWPLTYSPGSVVAVRRRRDSEWQTLLGTGDSSGTRKVQKPVTRRAREALQGGEVAGTGLGV